LDFEFGFLREGEKNTMAEVVKEEEIQMVKPTVIK